MRLIAVTVGLALLCGCGGKPSNSDPEIVRVDPNDSPGFDDFARFSSRLEDSVVLRVEGVDRIQIDPAFANLATAQELTDLLIEHQPQIERVIEASRRISPPIPPDPDFNGQDVNAGRHLDAVRARLLNYSRLLLADAVRCWSARKIDACAQRYAASLRIGLCLLNDADGQSPFRAGQVLYPTIRELDARITDGLGASMSIDARRELLDLVREIDTSRVPEWRADTPAGQAHRRLLQMDDEG